jgi:hypothetical protein
LGFPFAPSRLCCSINAHEGGNMAWVKHPMANKKIPT